ncbi:MAG: (deoxy)nucleoside triphosphate pyrophosphohydrolase [Candidatus Wallbacteria bacterium]
MPLPILVTAAVIINEKKKLFLARRKKSDDQGDLWELPGGKIEHYEKPDKCLEREISEELGMKIDAYRPFNFIYWEYSNKRILLMAYFCKILSGAPKTIDCADFGFFKARAIRENDVKLAPADIPLVDELLERGLVI